jgi:hypothetical protein
MAKFDKDGNRVNIFVWQKLLSDVKCRCGCGGFISNRAVQNMKKGNPNAGYVHGHIWKNRTLPESAKEKMRENHADFSGEKNPNFGKGLFGEDNPNWQGGKTLLYAPGGHPNAGTKQDLQFRKMIKDRDRQCVLCNSKSSLEVHHIVSWIDSELERFNPLNVVTLCKSCHVRADNAHHKDRIRPMLLAYLEIIKDDANAIV